MFNPNANQSPFNALPPVAVGLAMVIGAVEIVLQLGSAGLAGGVEAQSWRWFGWSNYAFFGPIWEEMLWRGQFPPADLIRFVTYPFIHHDFIHAAFAIVIVLAMGKTVGETFNPLAFLAIFFASAIAGALGYALLTDSNVPLIGAMPGGYGLIGAYTFLIWVSLVAMGEDQRRAFTLIGFLMAFQLVFGLIFGSDNTWIADIVGFAAGFGLSFLVSPGGWSRVLAKLRQR